MNPLIHLFTWAVLAVIVLAMAAYRYALVHHEDATLGLLESASQASEQTRVYRKAHIIERWGKLLTLVVIGLPVPPLAGRRANAPMRREKRRIQPRPCGVLAAWRGASPVARKQDSVPQPLKKPGRGCLGATSSGFGALLRQAAI